VTELPSGTVTFMFTDLVVSTRLWEQEPDEMSAALARHDGILRDAVESHGGIVVKGRGDGVHAVFRTADAAVRAAVDCERAMGAEQWAVSEPLRARIGIHTGAAELRDRDYFGPSVNRAARLEGIAHGGQIVCSQATADLARDDVDAGVGFVDLGEHELRDLNRPERVFQVTAPGLVADFPPLRSMDYFPGNLPKRASSFIGRARDLDRVPKALAEFPVVTLTGVGGVGKTRLAVQVAADLLPEFPDGAWMCELAAVRAPESVVEAVAGVFRVTARPGATLLESLVAYLRDQQLLLLLDNCEHLLRPAASLAAAIVGGCPKVRILATSREGLNIEGEQILVVPSLAVPDEATATDVGALAESEAVRLFVDRARAVKADFVLDETNAHGVAQLCRRLDGVPLAIELAAARVNAMSPAELNRRLDHRFRLLSGGDRVAIERHQTLRATIDWSFDLLTEAEQRLLLRLSVFSGGGTLDAVEAVCSGPPIGPDDVFDLMARLVAHHLVVADDESGETRYVLLETVRQYGEERLADIGETDAVRARHCDHFTEFTAAVRDESNGPRQIEWGTRLAREHDNVVAAMAFALETRDLERAMALLCAVPFYGMQVDDSIVFDPTPVLALPGASEHPGSATALVMEAWFAWERDDRDRTPQLCDEAVAAEDRLGRVPGTHVGYFASSLRGHMARRAGDVVEAARWYRSAADYADLDGSPALASVQHAMIASLRGTDRVAARAEGVEALAMARRSGSPHAIALSLILLASTVSAEEPDYARQLLDEAIAQRATGGYQNDAELQATVRAAGRLGAWPKLLGAAAAWFDLRLRSDVGGPVVISGMLYLAARALAEGEPEIAGVVQGAAHGQAPPDSDVNGPFMVRVDEDTTKSIVAAIGETRHAEANRQGAAMDADEACVYARNAIERYLAGFGDEVAR
jgi:predicted ATPase/class 3 adenylate cyclase